MTRILVASIAEAIELNKRLSDFNWLSISNPKEAIDINLSKECLLFKRVFFDDATPSEIEKGVIVPTEVEAKEILDFLCLCHSSTILINCNAGISRSAAVGAFLYDLSRKRGSNNPFFEGYFKPNRYLYNLLCKLSLENNYETLQSNSYFNY